jgi:hypothetical protein
VSLGDAADGGIARHLRDEIGIEREQRRAQAKTRRGHGGFASGMTGANYGNVVMFRERHARQDLVIILARAGMAPTMAARRAVPPQAAPTSKAALRRDTLKTSAFSLRRVRPAELPHW